MAAHPSCPKAQRVPGVAIRQRPRELHLPRSLNQRRNLYPRRPPPPQTDGPIIETCRLHRDPAKLSPTYGDGGGKFDLDLCLLVSVPQNIAIVGQLPRRPRMRKGSGWRSQGIAEGMQAASFPMRPWRRVEYKAEDMARWRGWNFFPSLTLPRYLPPPLLHRAITVLCALPAISSNDVPKGL